MNNVLDFVKKKQSNEKISMLTCYDCWSAQILNDTPTDLILVGDSASMIMHGHSSTLPATVAMMASHVAAVAKGAPDKFIVGDLPFLSFRKGLDSCMLAVEQIMQAGAHAVKLEGAKGNLELVQHIVESGIPTMGHLGLTPQSVHQLGGFKVQGRNDDVAEEIFSQAIDLQQAGCFALVLECVPNVLAGRIAKQLTIPVIGIGAGPEVDGQVLVLQDMLGLNDGFKPKFLRTFLNGRELFTQAITKFDRDVKSGNFPSVEESYE